MSRRCADNSWWQSCSDGTTGKTRFCSCIKGSIPSRNPTLHFGERDGILLVRKAMFDGDSDYCCSIRSGSTSRNHSVSHISVSMIRRSARAFRLSRWHATPSFFRGLCHLLCFTLVVCGTDCFGHAGLLPSTAIGTSLLILLIKNILKGKSLYVKGL